MIFGDRRLMYWTDVSARSPKIEYSWMNGAGRRTLVSERLLRPSGLAIDYHKNSRVFWCDSKANVIESVNHDGTDRAVVATSGTASGVNTDPEQNYCERYRFSIRLRLADSRTFLLSRTRTNFGDRAFSAAGRRVGNYLPTDVRQPDLSYRRFRQSRKTFSLVSATKAQCEAPPPLTAL